MPKRHHLDYPGENWNGLTHNKPNKNNHQDSL